MTGKPKPPRRVVTGQNRDGKSRVIFDSDAPNVFQRPGADVFFNELWTIEHIPAPLSGDRDDGAADRKFNHAPPARGAHFRIVQSAPGWLRFRGPASEEEFFQQMNRTGVSELKTDGPAPHFHRSPTVDYAFNLGSDRYLVLDDSEILTRRGDVVIQLGNYHAWVNRTDEPGCMGYDMIGGEYPD